MGTWIALGLLIVAGVALLLSHDSGTIAGFDNADFAGIVAAVALLIYLGSSLVRNYRGGLPGAVRDAVFWGALALALIAGYSYRDHVMPVAMRIVGELVPGTPLQVAPDGIDGPAVSIRKQANGQFVVVAKANGKKVGMIVDTGASHVVLTPSDARAAGINVGSLSYTIPMQTANGMTFGARVRLSNVSVGSVSVDRVDALVAKPGALRESLLGMSFLSRLRSYEFSGDFLTLRS